MKIYIDGKYYEEHEAKISVFDHGLLYGDGVFEGIRVYNGKIFKMRDHVMRLYRSAKAIAMDIGIHESEMENILLDAVKVNEKIDGYIRLIVTRGVGPLGIDPSQCKKACIIVIVADIQLYPKEFYEKGIDIMTSSYRRIPAQCFDTRIKSLNYLNNILAKQEARRNNCLESIMLNTDGFVAECTADNIFMVKDNVVITPSCNSGALEGVTRNTVLDITAKAGIEFTEKMLTTYDLYNSDECFLTGTGAEIMPVIKVDGRNIGGGVPGEITKKILREFRKTI
jgi:branched-chain amino acid aminotransferase